jgi:hypothetical protein
VTIHMHEEDEGSVLVVHISDKLTNADFEILAPEFERLVHQRGKVRVLYELTDFHGWDAEGLWDEIKFDFKNFADIERIAIIGMRNGSTVSRSFGSRSPWPGSNTSIVSTHPKPGSG